MGRGPIVFPLDQTALEHQNHQVQTQVLADTERKGRGLEQSMTSVSQQERRVIQVTPTFTKTMSQIMKRTNFTQMVSQELSFIKNHLIMKHSYPHRNPQFSPILTLITMAMKAPHLNATKHSFPQNLIEPCKNQTLVVTKNIQASLPLRLKLEKKPTNLLPCLLKIIIQIN